MANMTREEALDLLQGDSLSEKIAWAQNREASIARESEKIKSAMRIAETLKRSSLTDE